VGDKTYAHPPWPLPGSGYPNGATVTVNVGPHLCTHGASGKIEAFCMKVSLQ
jgi:hypothetical protein